jgi:hypothetical protein
MERMLSERGPGGLVYCLVMIGSSPPGMPSGGSSLSLILTSFWRTVILVGLLNAIRTKLMMDAVTLIESLT